MYRDDRNSESPRRRILVTGGAGFIGSHLVERLLELGFEVAVLDNLSTGRRENLRHLEDHDGLRLRVGDVLEATVLEPLVEWCDEIYHLAAAVGVRWIMERPVETIVTNVHGTENVLALAAKFSKKVFVASTSEVYGKSMETNGGFTGLNENDDWTLGSTGKRRWAYACSKAIDEFLALAFRDEKGLPVVVGRFFNVVGPRQSDRYGMVVPKLVGQSLAGEPMTVFGNGEQTRCFTHVGDAVRAMTDLMEEDAAEGEIVNIGSRNEVSINDLALRIKVLTGSDSPIVRLPYREVFGPGFEDMLRRTPDLGKIERLVGYQAEYDLDSILLQVIDHIGVERATSPPASLSRMRGALGL